MKRVVVFLSICFAFLLSGCRCEHEYGAWTVTTETSCHTEGVESRICAKCEGIENRAIPMSKHTMSVWEISIAPTCTTAGTEVSKCYNCAYSENRAVALVPHSMGEWTITETPSCIKEGKESRLCTVCMHSEMRTVEVSQTHTYGDWITENEASCIRDGSKKRICLVCGDEEKEAISKTSHKKNTDGLCVNCGKIYPSSRYIGNYFLSTTKFGDDVSTIGSVGITSFVLYGDGTYYNYVTKESGKMVYKETWDNGAVVYTNYLEVNGIYVETATEFRLVSWSSGIGIGYAGDDFMISFDKRWK